MATYQKSVSNFLPSAYLAFRPGMGPGTYGICQPVGPPASGCHGIHTSDRRMHPSAMPDHGWEVWNALLFIITWCNWCLKSGRGSQPWYFFVLRCVCVGVSENPNAALKPHVLQLFEIFLHGLWWAFKNPDAALRPRNTTTSPDVERARQHASRPLRPVQPSTY